MTKQSAKKPAVVSPKPAKPRTKASPSSLITTIATNKTHIMTSIVGIVATIAWVAGLPVNHPVTWVDLAGILTVCGFLSAVKSDTAQHLNDTTESQTEEIVDATQAQTDDINKVSRSTTGAISKKLKPNTGHTK
jgi:hypothetical protein